MASPSTREGKALSNTSMTLASSVAPGAVARSSPERINSSSSKEAIRYEKGEVAFPLQPEEKNRRDGEGEASFPHRRRDRRRQSLREHRIDEEPKARAPQEREDPQPAGLEPGLILEGRRQNRFQGISERGSQRLQAMSRGHRQDMGDHKQKGFPLGDSRTTTGESVIMKP